MIDTERIKKLTKWLIFAGYAENDADLASKLGYTKSSFSQITNGKVPLSDKFLDKLGLLNKNINKVWIKTGEGNMLLNEESGLELQSLKLKNKFIPLIPIEAAAGSGFGQVSIHEENIIDQYLVPDFVHADFMIRIKGSSMYPKYNSGDIIACKIIKDKSLIQWGKVFVLHHKEQGAIVKRLFPSDNETHFRCQSDNENYPPFEIKINDISDFALVVGVIRLE